MKEVLKRSGRQVCASVRRQATAERVPVGRRFWAGAVLTLGMTATAAAFVISLHDYPARHFGVVEDTVLYRSGQPDESGWEAIRRSYGIRTVVDLRRIESSKPWSITQDNFCRRNGINLIHIPIGRGRLTDAQFKQFLSLVMDRARRPVLVHCAAGESRTGVVVAAYRIASEGWTYESAIAEARRYGLTPRHCRAYDAWLRSLAAEAGSIMMHASLPTTDHTPS